VKVRELGRFIRDQRNSARLSLRKLSTLTGVSNPYLSQIERGLRRPSADILNAIAKALRISAETLYVQAGILDERTDADPVGEIRRDATISEKQKQILIDLYQSFRDADEDVADAAKPLVRAVSAPRKRVAAATVKKSRAAKSPAKRPASKAAKKPGAKKSAGRKSAARKSSRTRSRPTKARRA
jgi:transcriptional regulator with XRE-family HTH domain